MFQSARDARNPASTWLGGWVAHLAAVADVVLREPHVVVEIRENQLRLNHPELRQVPRGERILRTERRTESVDVGESTGTNLSLQLTGDSEEGSLAEEIFRVINLAIGRHRDALT